MIKVGAVLDMTYMKRSSSGLCNEIMIRCKNEWPGDEATIRGRREMGLADDEELTPQMCDVYLVLKDKRG